MHEPGAGPALRRLASPTTWKNWVRVANFFGYDSAERVRMVLGPGVRLSPTASIRNGERISIGSGSRIGQACYLWAGDTRGRILIGDNALLAPDVFITAANYDIDAGDGPVMDLPKREADVVIGANTWIGARVVVLPGSRIGEGAVVAAGAVVMGDIPPYSVVGGVPARVLRMRGDRQQDARPGQTLSEG